MMTVKEAVLKSLEEIGRLTNYSEVYKHIVAKKYYDFGTAKTPTSTISAQLGNFIRNGDTRVKRIKQWDETYLYYLTKNLPKIEIELLNQITKESETKAVKASKNKTYEERDLHKLLTTFLKSHDIHTKTIFHKKSSNSKDKHQKWVHPDMVGISLLKLQTTASQALQKVINRVDTLRFNSYEIKKEINNDYELKESFFQAVSNSSWANHGYLVAFEINDSLNEEMKRLNQSFGIGIIQLKANPFESQVLFSAKYKDLDFKTIDKLCKINKDFEKFIEQIEKLAVANERYMKATEKELEEFCDKYLLNDAEAEKYCRDKNIPLNNKE